jgi:glycosyltransferase involved in cell wall biosynthesis
MRHAARRHVIRAMLASVDLLVSPSRHLRERYVREFGLQADAIALCPYGIATRSNATRSARTSRGRLRVGYVGAVHFHKGVHVLLEALRRPLDADLSVFGASSEEFDAAFGAELRARAAVRGPIAADRRAAIYDDIDVLVVPSVHHENAPFVIQEAFAAGVPVIAADLAGMAEAVRDGVDGLLFRPGDAGALRAAVERVIKDRALLDRLAANVPAVKSLEDDAAEMATLYERARARKAVRRT